MLVACSGGADSLALLAAAVFEAREPAWRVVGVTVDHGLQEGSAERADAGRRADGARSAPTRRSTRPGHASTRGGLGPGGGRPRRRGTPCSSEVAERFGAGVVLLGHTRDDQAETVLLGLARGSGGRSLAGMRRALRRATAARCSTSPAPTP